MIKIIQYFNDYCKENSLLIALSFEMPAGYEEANGTFDPTVNTLFFNNEMLKNRPEYEQLFYLFHELRHASQYLHPEQFDELIVRSSQYVIMYDGTCFKLVDGKWKECRLEGTEDYFTEMYLGQPYEADANSFAYKKVKGLCGDSEGLRKLYAFSTPEKEKPSDEYEKVYRMIDELIDLR